MAPDAPQGQHPTVPRSIGRVPAGSKAIALELHLCFAGAGGSPQRLANRYPSDKRIDFARGRTVLGGERALALAWSGFRGET